MEMEDIRNNQGCTSKDLKDILGYGLSLNIQDLFKTHWKVVINHIEWTKEEGKTGWKMDYDVFPNPYKRNFDGNVN